MMFLCAARALPWNMDFVSVAPQVAFSGMGQARIENNLLLLYLLWGRRELK